MTPFDRIADAGRVVSDGAAEALIGTFTRMNLYAPRYSWEQRLAWAIESRSFRYRSRVLWGTVKERLSLATDALLGRHDCGDA